MVVLNFKELFYDGKGTNFIKKSYKYMIAPYYLNNYLCKKIILTI